MCPCVAWSHPQIERRCLTVATEFPCILGQSSSSYSTHHCRFQWSAPKTGLRFSSQPLTATSWGQLSWNEHDLWPNHKRSEMVQIQTHHCVKRQPASGYTTTTSHGQNSGRSLGICWSAASAKTLCLLSSDIHGAAQPKAKSLTDKAMSYRNMVWTNYQWLFLVLLDVAVCAIKHLPTWMSGSLKKPIFPCHIRIWLAQYSPTGRLVHCFEKRVAPMRSSNPNLSTSADGNSYWNRWKPLTFTEVLYGFVLSQCSQPWHLNPCQHTFSSHLRSSRNQSFWHVLAMCNIWFLGQLLWEAKDSGNSFCRSLISNPEVLLQFFISFATWPSKWSFGAFTLCFPPSETAIFIYLHPHVSWVASSLCGGDPSDPQRVGGTNSSRFVESNGSNLWTSGWQIRYGYISIST